MGSFAGYSVSVSIFEIVRLFFNGFFFWCCDWMDCFFGLFFPRPRTSYSSPCTYRSTFPQPQDFLDVNFLSRPCLLFRSPQDFFSMTNQKLCCFSYARRWLVMSEKDSWCLKKPDEAIHTGRHSPQRRHQESRLVAPRSPIWLLHTHYAWQTKLWLSEDVSVRFNQHLLKQCTHKYYLRLSG